MNRITVLVLLTLALATARLRADVDPPNGGRGAGTVPIWNPHKPVPGNPPLTLRVLVLNYDPIVPSEGNSRLSEVFKWNNPARMATQYREAMEYASGGYLTFEIVEWRNLNEIYALQDGFRYTIEEYVKNRKQGKGWRKEIVADYPRLLREQNVAPLVDDGRVDEVWIFSDHYFGLWEASMAGPGAFFINGGVYPEVPTKRPFAFYGFNYERGVAEMMHNTSHRTEATMNRAYGPWNLKEPTNNWEKFSANRDQSGGLAGVGTCHWPANAASDYDYDNRREASSWASGFLTYPKVDFTRKVVSRDTWSKGPDYHLDYMKWYFAHLPRAAGVNDDGRQNNWLKYIFDFQSYDAKGKPLPASAQLLSGDVADPTAAVHALRVAYRSAEPIDPRSLGDDDLTVAGPDGKTLAVKLVGGNEPGNRTYRVARYHVTSPAGAWADAPAGEFTVALRPNRVKTASGAALNAARLGAFRLARAGSGGAPLTADADTALLAHFDGNALAGKKVAPDAAKQLRFAPGIIGQGVVIGKGAELRYRSKGVIDPKAGTLEFWLKPSQAGNSGKGYTLFQAGDPFNNSMIVQVDGANNLRFIVWGDDPTTPALEKNVERGLGTSAGGWKADEWHHVAVTWADSGRKLALYVDGRELDATSKGVVVPALSQPTFTVGSGAGGTAPAEAVFDELRISRRARTAAEIRASADAATGSVDALKVELAPAPIPTGGRTFARALGSTNAGLTRDLTRDVSWISSDSKVATIGEHGTLRAGKPGQATVTARLGKLSATAQVKVIDGDLPQVRLVQAADVIEAGAGDVVAVISFDAANGIRADSIGVGSVRVVGPNGFHQFPEPISVKPGKGKTLVASYSISPPSGKWRMADQGEYTIETNAFQVADTKGNFAAESVLGRLQVLRSEK